MSSSKRIRTRKRSRMSMGKSTYITAYKARSPAHKTQFEAIEKYLIPDLAYIVAEYAENPVVEETLNHIKKGYTIGGLKEGKWLIYRKGKEIPFEEHWYRNGQTHKDDGPAVIQYRDDGSKMSEIWYRRDQIHRNVEPAVIEYNFDGSVSRIGRYQYGKLHSYNNLPARVIYDIHGNVVSEIWYDNGKKIRELTSI